MTSGFWGSTFLSFLTLRKAALAPASHPQGHCVKVVKKLVAGCPLYCSLLLSGGKLFPGSSQKISAFHGPVLGLTPTPKLITGQREVDDHVY